MGAAVVVTSAAVLGSTVLRAVAKFFQVLAMGSGTVGCARCVPVSVAEAAGAPVSVSVSVSVRARRWAEW